MKKRALSDASQGQSTDVTSRLATSLQRLFEQAAQAAAQRPTRRQGLAAQAVKAVGEAADWALCEQLWPAVQTHEVGHGRLEWRHLQVLPARLSDETTSWAGCQQVFAVERHTRDKRSGKCRHEIVYGITSLSPQQAGAADLLELCRGHWGIENRSHWVRDVTFAEDSCVVREERVAQVLAALRNTVIGLMRVAGKTNLAATRRYYAAQPWEALALLGIYPTFK